MTAKTRTFRPIGPGIYKFTFDYRQIVDSGFNHQIPFINTFLAGMGIEVVPGPYNFTYDLEMTQEQKARFDAWLDKLPGFKRALHDDGEWIFILREVKTKEKDKE